MTTFQENLIIAIAPVLVTGLGWLLYKHRKQISKCIKKLLTNNLPQNQTITFSIKRNEELNSGAYYDEIKRVYLFNLERYGLSEKISHKDFSDIFLFKDKNEAENYRNEKDLDLILWGEFSNDQLMRQGVKESEFTLNVTYGFNHHETNKEVVSSDITARIEKIIAIKNKWKIRNTESLEDVKDVADSLFTLSLFTLGLTLANRGRILDAAYIFEKLFIYLRDKNDTTLSLLKPYIKDCNLFLLAFEVKRKNIDWSVVCKLSSNILVVEPLDLNALVSSALSLYKLNRLAESELAVQKLIATYPRSGAARVNFAFMHVLKKNYDNALRQYKKVFSESNIDFATVEIIDFLNTEYEKTKEPALRFASGAISYYLNQDKNLAVKDLNEFLEIAIESTYGLMYKEARKILEEITNTNS